MSKEINDRINKVLREQLGVAESDIQPSSDLISDLGADSLDMVEIVMALEEEFEFEIPDEQAEDLSTVQDIITYIAGRVK